MLTPPGPVHILRMVSQGREGEASIDGGAWHRVVVRKAWVVGGTDGRQAGGLQGVQLSTSCVQALPRVHGPAPLGASDPSFAKWGRKYQSDRGLWCFIFFF